MYRLSTGLFALLLLFHGCDRSGSHSLPPQRHWATGKSPVVLAVYEPWFGHPRHISVGYSSHDPNVIRDQMHHARSMGISGFVVDWYGDREPFIEESYALMQPIAAKEHFKIAMMYDETSREDGATDEALSDFKMFHDSYLAAGAPGRSAYLTYHGHPMIFIFPKGGHTDWNRVRQTISQWKPSPMLIQENLPGPDASAFDGFYAWVQPGSGGWAADGSHWGQDYLDHFYRTMEMKYPDKMPVGGAWASFNDSKASWSLNRHISARCGQTFKDTFNLWRQFYPPRNPLPFLLIETWNDYEEGTAIERGIPSCPTQPSTKEAAP